MDTIINSVFAEIANCSHREHRLINGSSDRSSPLRVCIDSKVESLVLTSMHLIEDNPSKTELNKQRIKNLVKEAIHDCTDSLSEIGYNVDQWAPIENCILQRGDRLVDMAVDLMSDRSLIDKQTIKKSPLRSTEKRKYLGMIKEQRCSRRKKSSKKKSSKSKSKSSYVWKKK